MHSAIVYLPVLLLCVFVSRRAIRFEQRQVTLTSENVVCVYVCTCACVCVCVCVCVVCVCMCVCVLCACVCVCCVRVCVCVVCIVTTAMCFSLHVQYDLILKNTAKLMTNFARKKWEVQRSSVGVKSNFSVFCQKPWTIVHGLIFRSPKKVWRKVCHPKVIEKRNLMALVSVA